MKPWNALWSAPLVAVVVSLQIGTGACTTAAAPASDADAGGDPLDPSLDNQGTDSGTIGNGNSVTPSPAATVTDAGVQTPTNTPSDASTPDTGAGANTFNVGSSDCNNGKCRGGYGGAKDETELGTATEQCINHGYARATDFTISTQQPGGKFCSWVSGGNSYSCDNSCSGCNPMATINCVTP